MDSASNAIAIVGVGAIMPDAPDARTFWQNIKNGRYSINEVPNDRWDIKKYYDPDPKAPDKSYSKIGGWVREFDWEPLKWKLPVPPKVSGLMDRSQKWAIAATREALADFGYPDRPLDRERTAVILGNSMGGDQHLYSSARALFPEVAEAISESPNFAGLTQNVRKAILEETRAGVGRKLPEINEDTMPGELANIVAGRIAALFDLKGPNFVTDAACASAMAAISAAVDGLQKKDYDAVITGGIDSNMAPSIFVKFCKIGALSGKDSRPYADGADGFVMGEGSALFLLKRLTDAERDGDSVYAVIRGIGGSSDGKGKGITAPNPVGPKLAVKRGWVNAGLKPLAGDMIEGHGTSTAVGDLAELESLRDVLMEYSLPAGSVALGSVKSNIGHLKGAAGSAGMLKAVFAIRDKVLPPSLNFEQPNPGLDWNTAPFAVNKQLREWEPNEDGVRRAGVSSFGFGGTNFHLVMEEYVPGRLARESQKSISVGEKWGEPGSSASRFSGTAALAPGEEVKKPLRGALVIGGDNEEEVTRRLEQAKKNAESGITPPIVAPSESDLRSSLRIAIDFGNAKELADKTGRALKAFEQNQQGRWNVLRAKGIHVGRGPAPKVAFLFTGQGSQYVNMVRNLKDIEPVVEKTYAEADGVMKPILEKKLTDYIFVDRSNEKIVEQAHEALKQTEITQPAVLATETALQRLMKTYGIVPDMVMGHSLGEYGALVAAGALPFGDGLRAVAARGSEMKKVSIDDNGQMAAVWGPIDKIRKILETVDGYVVVANINSTKEAVIGGESTAVQAAMEKIRDEGYTVNQIPVSHAFHTQIVGRAAEALVGILDATGLKSPDVPVVANITGEFYPMGPGVKEEMLKILSNQVASPVKFVKGLNTLYNAGARVFVEMGPKRALYGFATDVVGDRGDTVTLFTNHPRIGDVESFNQALCGLYAAGLGNGVISEKTTTEGQKIEIADSAGQSSPRPAVAQVQAPVAVTHARRTEPSGDDKHVKLGKMFTEFLDRAFEYYVSPEERGVAVEEPVEGRASVSHGGIVVTGASLGLPGVKRVFDDSNVERILRGEQLIGSVPENIRRSMADKHINRLKKTKDGEASFETIDDTADVIKLAGRAGELDLEHDFGFPEDRVNALDVVSQLAIAAGIEGLRDAGIPLVMHYKTTTTGTKLPDRWRLPESMRDDTGVLFASAFPGLDSFSEQMKGYYEDRARRERLGDLEELRETLNKSGESQKALKEIDSKIDALERELEEAPFSFDRRFLFRVLSMGHSQFAEYIGARGPNVQQNGACASSEHAISTACDWIATGRCKRAILISADNITSDNLLEWFGSGFLASGSAATDEKVEDAAIPFDKKRHGLIIGMGGASMVVESWESARARGLQPICEILETVISNSAFHGTRLDVEHIGGIMEGLVSKAETNWGINRHNIAGETVFVSHETYTPARGGSASAEIHALRRVFGESADKIVIANTKGLTGHPMGVGIEEVVATKILETGIVPPVANFKDVDPELGELNLSKGGNYPVRYALRMAAGFGSQIGMTLMRWVQTPDNRRRTPGELGYGYRISDPDVWKKWLNDATGYEDPKIEVVNRTLRVSDEGPVEIPEKIVEKAAAKAEVPKTPRKAPEPVSATAAAAPAEAAVQGESAGSDEVVQKVLEIVSKQTGYPADMIGADLDLEADLGIDTVKQAEMFAAIREEYDIPREENLKLSEFPTLAHTVQFVYDKRPDLQKAGTPAGTAGGRDSAATAAVTEGVATTADIDTGDEVVQKVLEIVSKQTGYPADMIGPDLDLEADLGIDTVKQAEMFSAIREEYDIPREENLKLSEFPTLAHTVQFVYDKRPDLQKTSGSSDIEQELSGTSVVDPSILADEGSEMDTGGEVVQKVLEIVSKQTGYPADMIGPDLDLEADLGIDTVKQAEMFSAIREEYDIPREENLKLSEFPTLAHTVQFVYDNRPDLNKQESPDKDKGPEESGGEKAVQDGAAVSPVDTGTGAVTGDMDAANKVILRVPVPNLRPGLDFCKKTKVELKSGDKVIVFPDNGGVGKALISKLEKTGVTALVIEGAPQDTELVETIGKWKDESGGENGRIKGVYWLPALDDEPGGANWDGVDQQTWKEAVRTRVKLLYVAMRELYTDIGETGTFLVAGTRMGGQHGYDSSGAVAPMGGAVAGFTKTFKREKRKVLAKVVDFETSRKTAALAQRLIDETLRDTGAVEVGYKNGHRWTIGLEEIAPESRTIDKSASKPVEMDKDTVFVITGAAGSIVSAITADLAGNSGGTFHLLDLAPTPDPNDAEVQKFVSDKEGLKREVFERLKASGKRATPKEIEKELAVIERKHAALTSVRAVERAGGKAHYYSVDLRDNKAVANAMKQIASTSGRVDVLLHAAGLEISRLLPDKSPEEFNLVFDVKADGWFNIISNLGDMSLGAAVVFSSIAGRFGNAGQADYSAANDLLCKSISSFRTVRPDTKGIAIDWTAWSGIGMASRGSIPAIMKRARIDMLDPVAGIPIVRRELTSGESGEVVVAGSLGIMLEEFDSTGGLDNDLVGELNQGAAANGVMSGKLVGMGVHDGLTVETVLDPRKQPFLYDHQIGDTPVLPGVMGIEALVEAAKMIFPNHYLGAIEDVTFQSPFKFYRSEPRTVTVRAKFTLDGDDIVANCVLDGSRKLHGRETPEVTSHFKARVRLVTKPPKVAKREKVSTPEGTPVVKAEDIYRLYFHGPAYQVVKNSWRAGDEVVGLYNDELPANHSPEDREMLSEPRLIELCFQTAGLYELAGKSKMGLPYRIDSVEFLKTLTDSKATVQAAVKDVGDDAFDARVVDEKGNVYMRLHGYKTIELPDPVKGELLKPLRDVFA